MTPTLYLQMNPHRQHQLQILLILLYIIPVITKIHQSLPYMQLPQNSHLTYTSSSIEVHIELLQNMGEWCTCTLLVPIIGTRSGWHIFSNLFCFIIYFACCRSHGPAARVSNRIGFSGEILLLFKGGSSLCKLAFCWVYLNCAMSFVCGYLSLQFSSILYITTRYFLLLIEKKWVSLCILSLF